MCISPVKLRVMLMQTVIVQLCGIFLTITTSLFSNKADNAVSSGKFVKDLSSNSQRICSVSVAMSER